MSKWLNPRFPIPVFKFDRLLAASIPPPEQNPCFEPGNPPFGGEFRKVKKDFLKSPFQTRVAFCLEREYTCSADGGTCKALPHNPANSQLNLRNSVAFSTKNTQHGIVVRKMFFVHARPRTQVFLTYTPSPPRVLRVRLSCIAESTAEIRMVFA